MSGFSPATPAPHRSLWLEQALEDGPDAAPLGESTTADVCIIGGGFVGLWTAWWIKHSAPDCDVVVLERDICGGGASSRNGGFVLSWWAKFPSLLKLVSAEVAESICRESERAIDEIDAFCREHQIDTQIVRGGWLWTSRTDAGMGAWKGTVESCSHVNPEAFVELPPDEVARRAGSPAHLGGAFDQSGATIQPAILARGLRRACLAAGVRVYEHTLVQRFTRAAPSVVHTDQGTITTDRLVLATNAWSAGIPELRRHLVAISSDVVATDPMPDQLARIGWTGGEAITDSQQMVDYYRTTLEGRIVFGKGGWGSPWVVGFPQALTATKPAAARWNPTCTMPTQTSQACAWPRTGRGRSIAPPTACRCWANSTATAISCTAWAGAGTASARRWRAAGRSPTERSAWTTPPRWQRCGIARSPSSRPTRSGMQARIWCERRCAARSRPSAPADGRTGSR